jgi:copper chaperone CopZ
VAETDGTVVVIKQYEKLVKKNLGIFLSNKECKMKRVHIFALCGLIFGIMACSSEGEKHADVTLSTVQCGMCKKTIESGMAKVDGISKFDVDLNTKVGHVTYKASAIELAAIEKAVSALGYQANNTEADPIVYQNLPDCCKIGGMQ